MEGIPEGEFVKRRHNLPHWQIAGRTYFVTFRTHHTHLAEPERRIVLDVVQAGRARHFRLHAACIMPDHVHLLLTPSEITEGKACDLAQINKGIRGVSARKINLRRGAQGQLWQTEPYDRMIRDENEFSTTWNYIFHNPVWAGLVAEPEEYPFFWSEAYAPSP